MAELNEYEARQLAVKYYREAKYQPAEIDTVLAIMERVNLTGLIIFAYNQGVRDGEAEAHG